MEALTGCTRDELIGAPFKDYFTDPERAEAGIKLVLREKKVTDYELTACSGTAGRPSSPTTPRPSTTATASFKACSPPRATSPSAGFSIWRWRNKTSSWSSAKPAAEKANLAKSDFLSSMSHELRSPLNAILGFAQLMESDSPSPTPRQKESIDQILQAGWYLLDLINEILDLALIESGKLSLSREPVSLVEVMLECQAMIEPQAQKRGIDMTFPQLRRPCLCPAPTGPA